MPTKIDCVFRRSRPSGGKHSYSTLSQNRSAALTTFRSTANFQLLMLRFICFRTCLQVVDASEIDDRFFNSSGILTCRRWCNFVPPGFLDFRFLPLICALLTKILQMSPRSYLLFNELTVCRHHFDSNGSIASVVVELCRLCMYCVL